MPVLDGSDAAALNAAAQALARGELVAFATETVYGLGANADDECAVAGIFAAKGRPSDHPLIVHVADLEGARQFTPVLPPAAQALAQAFWPGPLTVIVPRTPGRAGAAAGGQDTVGLRCPAHPVANALLKRAAALGVAGVAAPSANRFGRVSPTTAAHVADEFGPDLCVLDGGPCQVGIESTIVDCSGPQPVLLRPGQLGRAAIEAVLGQPLAERHAHSPRASGTLEAHYAPRASVRLMGVSELVAAMAAGAQSGNSVAVYSRTCLTVPDGAFWMQMPSDADQAARALFAALRALDRPGITQIWVEQTPDGPEWEGVSDRLRRAAAATPRMA